MPVGVFSENVLRFGLLRSKKALVKIFKSGSSFVYWKMFESSEHVLSYFFLNFFFEFYFSRLHW